MAGGRDTPEERQARDESREIPPPPEDDEVGSPRPDEVTAAAYARGKRPPITASGVRIRLDDRRMLEDVRRRRQAWQSEAIDYYHEVGEFRYGVNFMANLCSKLRLFAAVRPDPKGAPLEVDDDESGIDPDTAKTAIATLDRLRSSQGGQSALIRRFALNLEVSGELYLHGHEDPATGEEDWHIRSVHELVVTGDQFQLRVGPGSRQFVPVPADDYVIRLWEEDLAFGALADSPTRSVLSELESLLLLSRDVRSVVKSRLSNGILIVPQEMSFGAIDPTRDEGDGQARDDPFFADLEEAQITAIQEEGAASAVMPVHLIGPGDYCDKVRHLVLGRPLDANLQTWIEGRILRIARGMNLPAETVTNLMNTTFQNANQIERQQFDAHVEPRAVMLCDALTAGYYRDALIEAGVPREKAADIFVWFDPSDLIVIPDQAEQARQAYEAEMISGEAARRYLGYSDGDAPEREELLLRALSVAARRMDPYIMGQLLVKTGLVDALELPSPQAGSVSADAPETPVVVQAAATRRPAAHKGAQVGRRLAEIDRDLRTRLHVASDAALRRVLERAGHKVLRKAGRGSEQASAARRALEGVPARKVTATLGRPLVAAMGLSDDDLLDGDSSDVGDDYDTWTTQAHRSALAVLTGLYGPADPGALSEADSRFNQAQARGREALLAGLGAVAAAVLFNPAPGVEPRGESPGSLVPMGVIRSAVAIAGGAQVTQGGVFGDDRPLVGDDGGPVGGLAVGPTVLSVYGGGANLIETWQWDYGSAPRTPFPPHEALDGVVFEAWDDDVLANDEGWPDAYCAPGDHSGCSCDALPTLSVPAELEGEGE